MANTVYKFQRTGNGFKERLIIKGFKYSDDKYKFLAMADNALFWKETTNEKAGLKPGTYAFAGGKWHNVKTLDASILAHI